MARLTDGFPTRTTFGSFPSVAFSAKTVTPPGMDAGGPNDTTTMDNIRWRTMQAKKLITLTQGQQTAAYDPIVYSSVVSMIGVNQLVTVTFPDGSTLAFWGFLDKFTPNEIKEGEQPTAVTVIEPTNQDNSGVEQAPVYTPG